ncbi:hypothetical protein DOY81_014057, partial [Sarcophaga bullata]
MNFVRDLPEKYLYPCHWVPGNARLRVPQDGIFSGTVDAFDSI